LARWITPIDRIVCDIGIPVEAVFVADGVGLQEPAEGGGVEPGFVVVEAEFGEPRLPGILEPTEVRCGGDAVGVVAVDREVGAAGPGDTSDAALMIAVEAAPLSQPCTLIPEERIIGPCAVDIAAHEIASTVILADQFIAVIMEPRGARCVATDAIKPFEPSNLL
jgi:hypothetical protein